MLAFNNIPSQVSQAARRRRKNEAPPAALKTPGERDMPFLDITVIPVPTAKKDAYLKHSTVMSPLFREQGALSVTETWGEDVPDGKVTDFKRAVALQDGETVAVGWITWPDKATRDAGWEKLMQDERMMGGDEPPFDGKRMIFAGFDVIAEN
jgi:uncharacterized protein YbaA (DUF1428 family)